MDLMITDQYLAAVDGFMVDEICVGRMEMVSQSREPCAGQGGQ